MNGTPMLLVRIFMLKEPILFHLLEIVHGAELAAWERFQFTLETLEHFATSI
eukprot:c26147_g1_i1 orf=1-153(-)